MAGLWGIIHTSCVFYRFALIMLGEQHYGNLSRAMVWWYHNENQRLLDGCLEIVRISLFLALYGMVPIYFQLYWSYLC